MKMKHSPAARRALQILAAVSVLVSMPTVSAIKPAPDGNLYIHVDDPRPVAKAATELSLHYAYGVSYEDPAYLFSDDVQDVTESVSKQPNAAATARRRVLVPAGGTLDVRFSEPAARGREAIASSIREVLAAQAATASGGRFKLDESPGMLHIVPTEVRGKNGDWLPQSSLLIQNISIPAGERSGVEMLRAITAAVSRATGQPIELGVMPLNAFGSVSRFAAVSAPARAILIDLLKQSSPHLTWRLLYAPDLQRYYLSIVSFANTDSGNPAAKGNATPPVEHRPDQGIIGRPAAAPRKLP